MMAVYVDPLCNHGWRLGPSCHLFADTLEDLHELAAAIGMKRHWFQNERLPHYDLTERRRLLALAVGAVPLSRREAAGKWTEMNPITREKPVKIKRLASGHYHARGRGPCNWAQWPCGELLQDDHFFREASAEFRRLLLAQLDSANDICSASPHLISPPQ